MQSKLLEAVRQGRLPGLLVLRDELAQAMTEANPAIKAQLAGRLQAVLAEIDSLAEPEEESDADAAARRATMRAI